MRYTTSQWTSNSAVAIYCVRYDAFGVTTFGNIATHRAHSNTGSGPFGVEWIKSLFVYIAGDESGAFFGIRVTSGTPDTRHCAGNKSNLAV